MMDSGVQSITSITLICVMLSALHCLMKWNASLDCLSKRLNPSAIQTIKLDFMFMQNQTNATRKQSQNTSDVILVARSLPHPELTAMMSMPEPLHFITTLSSFGYDPLNCPDCKHEMLFLELYYNHKRVSLEEMYEKAMSRSRRKQSSA